MTPEIERLRARLQLLEGRAKERQRRDRTRRLIVLGAAMELAWAEMPPEAQQASLARLSKHITTARDRALLGLPPLEAETDQGDESARS